MARPSKIVTGIVALVLVVGISVVGVYTTTRAEQKSTFAYIDTVRLWNELPQMHSMREILEDETKQRQAAYDTEAAKLTDENAKRELFDKYQDQLETRKDELFQKALDDTYQLIEKVATTQGIDVVLDKQGVLYGGVNLTDQVIAAAKAAK